MNTFNRAAGQEPASAPLPDAPLFPLPDAVLRPLVEQALTEDLGRRGDITSAAVIPAGS